MKVKASLKKRTIGGKYEKVIRRKGVRFIIPLKGAGVKSGRLKARTPISRRKKKKHLRKVNF
jgi:ribosomal protein L36